MSTSSTVTVLAEMDSTLGNDIDIWNWICVLVSTWGDGTMLGHSSYKEQDMVKVCIRLGQEHAQGVLQLSDIEAVLAFQCDADMMAMTCHLTAAKVWWGEPIILHILPLKDRQVREYIAKRSIYPSGAWMYM